MLVLKPGHEALEAGMFCLRGRELAVLACEVKVVDELSVNCLESFRGQRLVAWNRLPMRVKNGPVFQTQWILRKER